MNGNLAHYVANLENITPFGQIKFNTLGRAINLILCNLPSRQRDHDELLALGTTDGDGISVNAQCDGLVDHLSHATLHVPANSVEAYRNAEQWKYFGNIVALTDDDPKPTTISAMEYAPTTYNKAIYDLQGHQLAQPKKGLNIIRMSDGTTKKVIIK